MCRDWYLCGMLSVSISAREARAKDAEPGLPVQSASYFSVDMMEPCGNTHPDQAGDFCQIYCVTETEHNTKCARGRPGSTRNRRGRRKLEMSWDFAAGLDDCCHETRGRIFSSGRRATTLGKLRLAPA